VIKEAINDRALSIALSFSGKISGTLYSVMTKKDVAFISDLMMMGDGTTAYSEEHNDAISELYNQVMGAFTTILGDKCGGSVTSADNAKVSDLDTSFKEFAAESTDLVITTIKITDTDEFSMGFIIPRDIGLQLMNIFKENSNISADTIDNRSGSLVSDNDKMTDSSSSFSDTGNDSFQPSNRSSGMSVQAPRENIDMLLDIELDVSIELGRADLSIKKILELAPGSIVELERMAGEPVDLMVNNRVVAKGEVVIVDENFGIRIVSLVSPEERIKSLR
jgi:flagellar motor switch protein FliN/FliY